MYRGEGDFVAGVGETGCQARCGRVHRVVRGLEGGDRLERDLGGGARGRDWVDAVLVLRDHEITQASKIERIGLRGY